FKKYSIDSLYKTSDINMPYMADFINGEDDQNLTVGNKIKESLNMFSAKEFASGKYEKFDTGHNVIKPTKDIRELLRNGSLLSPEMQEEVGFYDDFIKTTSEYSNKDRLNGLVLSRGIAFDDFPELVDQLKSGFIDPDKSWQYMSSSPNVSKRFMSGESKGK